MARRDSRILHREASVREFWCHLQKQRESSSDKSGLTHTVPLLGRSCLGRCPAPTTWGVLISLCERMEEKTIVYGRGMDEQNQE